MLRKHFEQQLSELQELLLKMGALVEEEIELAIKALIEQDVEKADRVLEMDDRVDQLELQIEEMCIGLIALQQPLAKDLRRIGTVLKIITDLERIGDHGVNIARVVKKIGNQKFVKPLEDLPKMADIVKKMVKESLDSFIKEDIELAKKVAATDDLVDDLYESIYVELLELLTKNKEYMQQIVYLLFIGRYLERIADHTTNICERIMYMNTGERYKF